MEMTHEAGVAKKGVHVNYWSWAKTGMVGGLLAGLAFAVFEMIVAAIVAGQLFGPFRMISATVLGQQALSPQVSLATAIMVGTLVHLVYSVVAGAVFALIVAAVTAFHRTPGALVSIGGIYGLLMWLVNFYLIAPAFGWIWFPQRASQFWQGFVAHTFLYGALLGWYVAARQLAKPKA